MAVIRQPFTAKRLRQDRCLSYFPKRNKTPSGKKTNLMNLHETTPRQLQLSS